MFFQHIFVRSKTFLFRLVWYKCKRSWKRRGPKLRWKPQELVLKSFIWRVLYLFWGLSSIFMANPIHNPFGSLVIQRNRVTHCLYTNGLHQNPNIFLLYSYRPTLRLVKWRTKCWWSKSSLRLMQRWTFDIWIRFSFLKTLKI